jgi:hypothetical protein
VIQRVRHIFTMNQAELTQVTLILVLGLWWVAPGATWSLPPYSSFDGYGLSEEVFGLLMVAAGSGHAIALWFRHYKLRQAFAALEAIFWFSLAIAIIHASPLSSMGPICFINGVSVATTFWRIGGRF